MQGQTMRLDQGRQGILPDREVPFARPSVGRRWRRHPVVTVLVGTALLLAACSGSGDSRDTASDQNSASVDAYRDTAGQADPAVDEETSDMGAASDAGGGAEAAGEAEAGDAGIGELDGTAAQPAGARTGRRVVRTARLELDVDDPAAAADRIARIADDAGGFIAETDLERELDGTVRGSITLRVPSEALFATVEELDALAVAVPVRRIDERDVTTESTDLQARLTNLTAYEIELRALLSDVRESTTRPDDLLTVFERIRSVRAEIDQLDARSALLDDQVALSTISVALRPAASAVPVVDPSWAPSETVRDALTTTARALSGIADVAIRFALTVLPIGLLLGGPVLVAVVVWRRVHGNRTPPAPAAP
jgi:hypothetical protein